MDNCWNNPIIAWALIDLEIVEQLAKKHDKYFVGSLQKGRYMSITYFLYQNSQTQFKDRAHRMDAQFLDDLALKDFYPPIKKQVKGLTPLKDVQGGKNASKDRMALLRKKFCAKADVELDTKAK